jgi:hypothetical protein
MAFCPDKPILAGLSGGFDQYPVSALAGRHDDEDVICLTPPAVNNPHPAMQCERVVRAGQCLKKPSDIVGEL